MIRKLVVIALLSLAAEARAALVWTTDYDAALRRARGEKKLVLVVTKNCTRCDKVIAAAEAHDAVLRSMEAFVLVRGKARGAKENFQFVDPDGELLVDDGFGADDINRFSLVLTKLRQQAPSIILAVEQRHAGQSAEANLVLGNAYLELEQPQKALWRFERAADDLRARKDRIGEQFAEMHVGFALFVSGQRPRGTQKVESAIRNALNDENAAEAWYILGVIRRIERNERDAIKAFRKAWDFAPANTHVAAAIRNVLEAIDKRPLPSKEGTTSTTVRVIPPARRVVTGSVEFVAEVAGAASFIDFFLDNVKVATVNQRPFAARIDLGSTPRARTVRAVAFDKRRTAIGESVVTVNDREDAFYVTITSPVAERASGDVTLEADVHVPPDRKLAKLELYWKNSRLGTFTEPPFRLVFVMPKDFGYIRALGTLDDGTTAENTKLMNSGTVSETVDVQGVTFIANVLDANGKRVDGLTAKDFRVQEEGQRVDVTLRASADEPVMVGIAIDISRSMRPVQLDVIEIASALVKTIASPKSKVFLVVFDNDARMLHPATSDVASLDAK
ncbi:MAG TPA: hypothetical protein VMU84_05575, partial [Thermoanaerobaculia bacterium]|nr:hypothetical protein [Thermoanaerobaculia bacterium]